jgi:hypothetical protein
MSNDHYYQVSPVVFGGVFKATQEIILFGMSLYEDH